MDRTALLSDAVNKIKRLPDAKLQEINDFADFLLRKLDDKAIVSNIQHLTSQSKSFHFLNEEDEIYNEEDLKERFQ